MRVREPPPAERIRRRWRLLAIAFAIRAVLGQAFIPAYHPHGGAIDGGYRQDGSNQPDQDGDDDCPICQAAHAIGAAILPAPASHPVLAAVVLRTSIPEPPGHIDRRKADRPRQRAPPSLI